MRFNHLQNLPQPVLRLLMAGVPLILMTGLMLMGVIMCNVSTATGATGHATTGTGVFTGVAIIPEPSTMALLGLGTGLLAARRLFKMGYRG